MNERRPSSNPPTIDLSDSLVLPVVSLDLNARPISRATPSHIDDECGCIRTDDGECGCLQDRARLTNV